MTVDINYIPNKKQAVFHSLGSSEVVYGGAKGGGKSCALVMEAVAYALEHPGATLYLFHKTYDDLETNLIFEFVDKVQKELYIYKSSKHTAYLKTKPMSAIHFRYVSGEDDAARYQGRPIDWIGIDELTDHTERTVQLLLSCMRSAKGFPTFFRATCNPGGIGHNWVKERYIDGTGYGAYEYTDKITKNSIAFVPASVYDNDILMKNDPLYVSRLENLPENEKRAFLFGDWDVFEGQFFSEFKRDVHICKPFDIPDYWERFCSLDYGLDMTACLWWGVDGEGRCYIYREVYKPNLTLSMAAEEIISAIPENEPKPKYIVASPDLWNRRQETGESGFEIMSRTGLLGLVPANNNRIAGWRALREYLRVYKDEQGIIRAKIAIFNTCSNLARCLPLLLHDKYHPEDALGKPHEVTHAPDALRYGVMSRPIPLQVEKPVVDPFHLLRDNNEKGGEGGEDLQRFIMFNG